MRANVIILGCGKPWSFTDQNTGELKEGCTIHYIMADEFEPVDNDGVLGYTPVKESVGKVYYETFKKLGVPCSLTAEMGQKVKDGTNVLFIKGFDLDAKKK